MFYYCYSCGKNYLIFTLSIEGNVCDYVSIDMFKPKHTHTCAYIEKVYVHVCIYGTIYVYTCMYIIHADTCHIDIYTHTNIYTYTLKIGKKFSPSNNDHSILIVCSVFYAFSVIYIFS